MFLMKSYLLFFCLLLGLFVNAQYPQKIYNTKIIQTEPLKIDGEFTERIWEETKWEGNFVQISPREGRNPYFQTEFAILYDKNNFYIGIRAFDKNPDSISVRMTRRDEADGDGVSIIFDSYNDKRTGFAFSVSAAGNKTDFILSEDGVSKDDTRDPIWWVKTKITKGGGGMQKSEFRLHSSGLKIKLNKIGDYK